ncbi:helix-turn-helix transcriptional regulator [Nocardia terpenica]|uniref:TetR/AcrR family transcriptional regulator n=1 Tax=Nocardia terpenica TaxID=455432 RepID=UPI001895CC78|nr:TetR/AcrR family transcriptional regulator [Nocardia terpenica]MBF6059505.1 helix-turn-helix transcriptional regulator [Nocardia terpenica]MBF6102956.1 helix-turn-helix transcriptional regulator [Nocardia terpenica]MBF6110855.1 helix-turn-helix transcriptional regulator [Nocardia terpenica]MBF6116986.1 helix-turn-helix transcriptional regulator [Nocardia terpenica]MBF6151176.1 helix-turn-helix transcriptional regulator [Nocardia terpenica]
MTPDAPDTTSDGLGHRDRRRARTRDRILDAALELFAAHGMEATTFDQIAELADVSRQTVFNHFPRKDDLVDAWGERRRGHLRNLLAEEHFRSESTAAQLTAQLDVLADYNERERALTQRVFTGSARFGTVAHDSPVGELFARSVRSGIDRGDIAAHADPDLAGEMLADCYFGTLNHWLRTTPRRGELRRRLQRKLDILLAGLAP